MRSRRVRSQTACIQKSFVNLLQKVSANPEGSLPPYSKACDRVPASSGNRESNPEADVRTKTTVRSVEGCPPIKHVSGSEFVRVDLSSRVMGRSRPEILSRTRHYVQQALPYWGEAFRLHPAQQPTAGCSELR